MDIGMMWFDNDPKTGLLTKIERAAEYYRNKYGCRPDLCLVNPTMLPAMKMNTGGITVRSFRSILPGILWLGVNDRQQANRA